MALGYTRESPDPPRGEIQRDSRGDPTGMPIATPDARILYTAIAGAPEAAHSAAGRFRHCISSASHRLRDHERDRRRRRLPEADPDDYGVVEQLAKEDRLTVRIAMNLFTQRPGEELEDFHRWAQMTAPDAGDEWASVNGVGEMIRYKCYDFENFEQPRPDPLPGGEDELEEALSFLVERRWPFRMHATYDESVRTYLDVIERVEARIGLDGLRWFFDHCETVSEASIERIAALGGGIAIQDRMAFAGERFIDRYGQDAADRTPPVQEMLSLDLPVGAGTDATRVASYNPWVSLYWLVAGRTVGGTELWSADRRLDRVEALRLYTHGSAWFSGEHDRKGTLTEGAFADLAVLSDDYLSIPDEHIKHISSVLTVVGGRIVHGDLEFAELAPLPPPAVPDWTPYGTDEQYVVPRAGMTACTAHLHLPTLRQMRPHDPFAGACFAF